MQLTIKLIDERYKPGTANFVSAEPKREDYTRFEADITGNAASVAGALRALADDICPPPVDAPQTYGVGAP